ncbi:hypothetical protein LIER_36664 [Lithospermum erythrorhizon]|uniref:Uncharacterized protein n=1 Tax=Lithospermum erythrorhizon TaxID=34254 RepID=A0AAV3PB57_LITER
MKIKTTQACTSIEVMTNDEKKKTQEAGASTIEVHIKDFDKTKLNEFRPDELKKVSLNTKDAEEEVIAYKKARKKNKKSLALVAAKTEKLIQINESGEEGADELVMLAKIFKKLLKYKNNKGEYPQKSSSKRCDNYEKRDKTKEYGSYTNDQPKYFECN